MVLCPINSWTVRRSTPAITRRLANVWRKQCQVKSFRPAAFLTQIRPGKLAVGTFPAHQVRFQVIATGGNDMGIVGVRALQASRIQVDVERMTVSLR
jgi:hypothetical protein